MVLLSRCPFRHITSGIKRLFLGLMVFTEIKGGSNYIYITLTAPITTAADDILIFSFLFFREKGSWLIK